MKKRTGLFDKLLILHLFSTSVLFLIIIISYYHIEKDNFNKTLIKKSILIHDLLKISCVDPIVGTIAYDRTDQIIEALYEKNREIVYIEIYDPTARIIAFVGKPPKVHLNADEINRLFKQDFHAGQQTNKTQNYDEFMTYLKAGDYYLGMIRAGFTKTYFQKQLRGNILYFLGFFIIAIAVTSLIFFGCTNQWIILPIINVSKIMRTFGQDELHILLKNIKRYNQSITKDEIGIMSIAFERMISSIMKRTKEKEKAELALVKSERNYREIFNASSDAIFIRDEKTGRIIDVNEPMLKMYGYKKEEVLGLNVENFSSGIAPYDQEDANKKIKRMQEQGPQIFEWQAKKKNGEIFWVEVNLRLSKIGDKNRVLTVVRDITQRKKAQEMMVQSEKMLSVGGLAAGMAHEINNPLAGMMQTASVLANRLGKNTNIPANVKAAKEANTSMEAIQNFMEARGIFHMDAQLCAKERCPGIFPLPCRTSRQNP